MPAQSVRSRLSYQSLWGVQLSRSVLNKWFSLFSLSPGRLGAPLSVYSRLLQRRTARGLKKWANALRRAPFSSPCFALASQDSPFASCTRMHRIPVAAVRLQAPVRKVQFIFWPTRSTEINWCKRARFHSIRLISNRPANHSPACAKCPQPVLPECLFLRNFYLSFISV